MFSISLTLFIHPLSFVVPSAQAWEGDVFMKLPTAYNDLKFIKAMSVNFQEMNEASLFHHLILHAPNLEKLQISVSSILLSIYLLIITYDT